MSPQQQAPRAVPLFWRTFLTNAGVLVAAGLALVVSPATVSSPVSLREAAVIGVGVCAMLLLNLLLMRRAFLPLERLAAAMGEIDLQRSGQRVPELSRDAEVLQFTEAFNAMLERLERERRESARTILSAQEEERARIARELHDEVGQALTAGLLHLEHASRENDASHLAGAKETVRDSLEQVRQITLRLRPEALDDLGLRSALLALSERIVASGQIDVHPELPAPFPTFSVEQELVAYRVAQEALTNVLRHARASNAWLTVSEAGETLRLAVEDDGDGFAPDAAAGAGVEGMRERALLVSGSLRIGESDKGGAAIELSLPRQPR